MKIDGKPMGKLPLPHNILKKKLEKLPNDIVYTTAEVAKLFNIPYNNPRNYLEELKDYTYRLTTKRYWGNKASIKKFREFYE